MVHQCPGYENFLRPKKLAVLFPAAALGPIAYINVDKSRCDAIILQNINEECKLNYVRLSLASLDKIKNARSIFAEALIGRSGRCVLDLEHPWTNEVSGNGSSFPMPLNPNQTSDDLISTNSYYNRATKPIFILRKMKQVLQTLRMDVVKPIFQALKYIDMNAASQHPLPRITWCKTGPSSFLPLHAAGQYSQDDPTSDARAYKYAVSSYTPSLSMLLRRKRDTYTQNFLGLTAISQPSTPGQSPLPNTVIEAQKIQENFLPSEFTWLNGVQATKEAVLQQMRKNSWIHLACHGERHNVDPMKSAFILHDGPLDLRKIFQETLPHARLAFLSACQTAKGDEKLPQEWAHLAAGMLMIGYHTAIGTMWSIRDRDAPIVAAKFYNYLKTHGMKTNDGQAAYALHEAVALLREKLGEDNFLSWAPFIHLGI